MLVARADLRAKSRELPSDFSLSFGHPVLLNPDTWVLGPVILTRGSGLLEQSNYHVLLREIKKHRNRWRLTRASHWGSGWVEHLSFQMYRKGGVRPTALYAWLRDWFLTLAEHYPVADDSHHSAMQHAAALEHIQYEANKVYDGDVTGDLCRQVFSWLWDHEQVELEDHDGHGARPSRDAVRRALEHVLGRSLECDES
jgi:hypothetical protein